MGDLEMIEVMRSIFNDRIDESDEKFDIRMSNHEKNIEAKIISLIESQKVTNQDVEKVKRETRFIRNYTKAYDKKPTKVAIITGISIIVIVGVANMIKISDLIIWIKTLM